MKHLNELTEQIIGCAIEVHRHLGPGLLESVYEKALCYEFNEHGIGYESQVVIPITYKNVTLGDFRLDFL
jgi:GxxExxY protein